MAGDRDVRVGDAEREQAHEQLADHFAQGRLDLTEFEERTGTVASARTSGELEKVFHDLPTIRSSGATAPARSERRWINLIPALMPFIATILFFTVQIDNAWLFFLLIPASGILFRRSDDD